MNLDDVLFNSDGLVPAIVQSVESKRVLMLAWMNREAITKTLETRESHFFSRSRQELWHKGETSGNTQKVESVEIDCDGDTILVHVYENGPACHTGSESCFDSGTLANPDSNVAND